jgi:hypothetical protein
MRATPRTEVVSSQISCARTHPRPRRPRSHQRTHMVCHHVVCQNVVKAMEMSRQLVRRTRTRITRATRPRITKRGREHVDTLLLEYMDCIVSSPSLYMFSHTYKHLFTHLYLQMSAEHGCHKLQEWKQKTSRYKHAALRCPKACQGS